MANIVTTSLLIDETNAKTYCTATNLELEQSSYAFYLYLDGKSDGWAYLNDTAKEVLYPSATAHPFRLDSIMSHSRSGGSAKVNLEFDDIIVHNTEIAGITQKEHIKTEIVDDTVLNSTRATKIGWHIKGSSTVSAFRVGHVRLDLYFNQYRSVGNKALKAKGVDTITVSNSAPYEGDPVTFSATLFEGSKWYGWYADEAHTQLVSKDLDYTIIAGEDITLYAYASLGTGLYLKKDNQWINSINIYKKINGEWIDINKTDFNVNDNYTLESLE